MSRVEKQFPNISLLDARACLISRLWTRGNNEGISSPSFAHRPAIAQRRIWQALKNHQIHATARNNQSLLLEFAEFDEILFDPTERFNEESRYRFAWESEHVPKIAGKGFQAWLECERTLTQIPDMGFITVNEAVSFIAWGEYLSADDLWAIVADRITENSSKHSSPDILAWNRAGTILFNAHMAHQITLTGLSVSNDRQPIPDLCFADSITVEFGNSIVSGIDKYWRDVTIMTSEFRQWLKDRNTHPTKRGAKPQYDWAVIKAEFDRLMNDNGDFIAGDQDWSKQANLESALMYFCEGKFGKQPGNTTIRTRVKPWLNEWRTTSQDSGRNLIPDHSRPIRSDRVTRVFIISLTFAVIKLRI